MAKSRGRNRAGRNPHRRNRVRNLPRPIMEGLAEAEQLSDRGRHYEAREILQNLHLKYPESIEVLNNLANEFVSLNDMFGVQWTAERLLKLDPDNDLVLVNLGGAYLANQRPLLAARVFRDFLNRWPEHERAAYAREMLEKIAPLVELTLAGHGFTGDDAVELGCLHEEAQTLLSQGEYVQARAKLRELLRRRPDFYPALNNLSLLALAEGDLKEASATAQQVLAFDPQNFNALANLTRFLVMSGRSDEARPYAERLKAIPQVTIDVWVKKAEAFGYLGDDAALFDLLREVEEQEEEDLPESVAFVYHLAAVAKLRAGDEILAKRLWHRALRLQPGYELAEENMRDLRQPVGERHAPWPFALRDWVRPGIVEEFVKQMPGANEHALQRASRELLKRHPEMKALIGLLLERGDPVGRELAFHLITLAQTPELLAQARDFALSRYGPDSFRMRAADLAAKAGLLDAGMVRLWIKGEQQEVLLFNLELHGEPMGNPSPQALRLAEAMHEAIARNDGVEAERLIREGMALEPDSPGWPNNLSKAYQLQGRHREAAELAEQVHERFPDYLFGRANLALMLIERDELERAEELLKPLLQRTRMHFSEYTALASAEIMLAQARGDERSARQWYEMLERVIPDNPILEHLRPRSSRRAAHFWRR